MYFCFVYTFIVELHFNILSFLWIVYILLNKLIPGRMQYWLVVKCSKRIWHINLSVRDKLILDDFLLSAIFFSDMGM